MMLLTIGCITIVILAVYIYYSIEEGHNKLDKEKKCYKCINNGLYALCSVCDGDIMFKEVEKDEKA